MNNKSVVSKKLYFGSVEWANDVLKEVVIQLKNWDRSEKAVLSEVFVYLDLLEEFNYSWQVARVRNWVNWAEKKLPRLKRLRALKERDASQRGGRAPGHTPPEVASK